jgi:protein-S-isoprenylcysteine O-methyltransferase Ste14
MSEQLAFRLLFAVAFFAILGFRVFEHVRAGNHREPFSMGAESRAITWLRLAFPFVYLPVLVLYFAAPATVRWAEVPLPAWAHWLGLALLYASGALLAWVHVALGKNFSTNLRLRNDHTFVSSGPYRWVRHPMYNVFCLMFVGIFLATGHALVGLIPLAGLLAIMVWRTPQEERLLAGHFGEAYLDYCRHTGRFLPRLRRREAPAAVA